MLGYLTLLLTCQLIGEVLVRLTGLPLPGPVVGMLLLFTGLVVRGSVPTGLDTLSRGLLGHLSLLFVPAGVGVVVYLSRVGDEWLALSAALLVSTALAIGVTAWVMQALVRRAGDNGRAQP